MLSSSARLESLRTYYTLKLKNDPTSRRWRDRVAAENDKLAISIARRMLAVCTEPLEDLTQMARIGLLKAIERFNPTMGVAFSSFAVPYIRGEMLHFLRDHWGLLKIPRRWREKMEQVERIEKKLLAKGRHVDRALIADSVGISKALWSDIEAAFNSTVTPIYEAAHLSHEIEDTDRLDLQASAIARVALLPNPMRDCLIEHVFGKLKADAIAKSHHLDSHQVKRLIDEGLQRLRSRQTEADVEAIQNAG